MKIGDETTDQDSPLEIEKLQAGEIGEFEKIYQKYVHRVYAYAFKILGSREDSEEVTQEIFCAIWQQRQTVRSEGFVWIVAKHKCIDRLRKPKIPILTAAEVEIAAQYKSEAELTIVAEEEKRKILKKLSSGEQQVLSLLFQGISRKEIAQLLGLPIGTIDSRLHRIKKKLQGENHDE